MKRSEKAEVKSKSKPEHDLIPQEVPERAPAGWAEVQARLAEQSGISILLVEGHQPPALVIANNNSICHALQSSPNHAKLCDPFCGEAHARAKAAKEITHYRCHAGLQCFAMPVKLDERALAAIGGRAFVHSADYRSLVERFRSGDLKDLFSEEVFQNVIFADEADLDHTALRLTQAMTEFKSAPNQDVSEPPIEDLAVAVAEPTRMVENAAELTATETWDESFLTYAIRKFAEQIDASDPAQTYESIVAHSADLLHAERGSLLLLDESSNQLTMTAARGIPTAVSQVADRK